jgi:hypothetical protein
MGDCTEYSLGDPTNNHIQFPTRITLPSGFTSPIKTIVVANNSCTFFLLHNGQVLICGYHEYYCDENETNEIREYQQTKDISICDIVSGTGIRGTIVFLGNDNQVYISASFDYGQFGEVVRVDSYPKLVRMERFADRSKHHVTHIAIACCSSIFVICSKYIYFFGKYFFCPYMLSNEFQGKPYSLPTDSKIVQVSAEYLHANILTEDGEVWVAGKNNDTYLRGDTRMKTGKFYNLNKLNNMNEKYVSILATFEGSIFATKSRKIYLAGIIHGGEEPTQIPNTGLRQLNIDISSNIRNIFYSFVRCVVSTEDRLLIPFGLYSDGMSNEVLYSISGMSYEYNMYACLGNKEIFYQGKEMEGYWIQKHFHNKLVNYYDIEFLFSDQ